MTTTFKNNNSCNDCIIQMVGVWDTVGALGIPLPALMPLNNIFFNFHNTSLHANVRFGYQALAIDEMRTDFKPTLWNERQGIEQVWFGGAHADVGGGYAEHGLSDIALNWMMTKALLQGVHILDTALNNGVPNIIGSPYDVQHFPWEKPPFSLLPIASRVIPEESEIHNSVKLRMSNASLNYHPTNLPKQIKYV